MKKSAITGIAAFASALIAFSSSTRAMEWQFAMARTPPKSDQKSQNTGMGRYIVTHKCKKGTEQGMASAVGNEPFKVTQVFDFSGQFVVETTSRGAEMLKSHSCVTQVQQDLPTGLNGSG